MNLKLTSRCSMIVDRKDHITQIKVLSTPKIAYPEAHIFLRSKLCSSTYRIMHGVLLLSRIILLKKESFSDTRFSNNNIWSAILFLWRFLSLF